MSFSAPTSPRCSTSGRPGRRYAAVGQHDRHPTRTSGTGPGATQAQTVYGRDAPCSRRPAHGAYAGLGQRHSRILSRYGQAATGQVSAEIITDLLIRTDAQCGERRVARELRPRNGRPCARREILDAGASVNRDEALTRTSICPRAPPGGGWPSAPLKRTMGRLGRAPAKSRRTIRTDPPGDVAFVVETSA